MKQDWNRTGGGVPMSTTRRNGVRWNEYEDEDLRDGWLAGKSVGQLVEKHERLHNAIEIRLCKIFGVDFVNQLPRVRPPFTTFDSCKRGFESYDPMLSRPKRGQAHHWTSNDGRCTHVDAIPIDHLVNILHDCAFRTAAMRHQAVEALGGTSNANVNPATFGSFRVVKSSDVFPAFDAMLRRAQTQFRNEYAVSLDDTKKAIFDAWQTGRQVPATFERAVRFVLRSGKHSPPARFDRYVKLFAPKDDNAFRRMCWNLRIDQPDAAKFLRQTGHPVTIQSFGLHTAFNFEPSEPSDAGDGFFDSWDY